MDGAGWAGVAFALATALHLGFQATVTLVVYPALAQVPASDWSAAHERHSRGITPLVVLTYGALVVTGGWALLSAGPRPWLVAAALGALVAVLGTAFVAAPTHGRLSGGPEPRLLRRLLLADRLRLLGALVAFLTATAATLRP